MTFHFVIFISFAVLYSTHGNLHRALYSPASHFCNQNISPRIWNVYIPNLEASHLWVASPERSKQGYFYLNQPVISYIINIIFIYFAKSYLQITLLLLLFYTFRKQFINTFYSTANITIYEDEKYNNIFITLLLFYFRIFDAHIILYVYICIKYLWLK